MQIILKNSLRTIHKPFGTQVCTLTAAYVSEVMSIQAGRKWSRQFKNGQTSVMESAGQSVSVSIDELRIKIDLVLTGHLMII